MQSNYLDISAGEIHYVSAGNRTNETIVFLHGFPEFWYSWRKQLEYFSSNYHVVAPDLRGYNKSFKPKNVSDYEIDKIANDVIELIRSFGKDKVSIVGHDWGAAITWHLLLMHPDRFTKGVILNVPHPLVMRKNVFTNPRQLLKSWYMFFFQIPRLPYLSMSRNNFERTANKLKETSLEGSFSEEDLRKYKTAWGHEEAMRYMIKWYKAALRKPSQAGVYKNKKVKVPLKIIWGKNDVALLASMAKESLTYCENGQLTYLEHATHWVHQDCPEEVNRLIEQFLKL